MAYYYKAPLFPLGDILCSPGAEALGIDLHRLLRRHQSGDWGEIPYIEDITANDQSIVSGEAILSLYEVVTPAGEPQIVAIMTENDRSLTMVFLSNESPASPEIE